MPASHHIRAMGAFHFTEVISSTSTYVSDHAFSCPRYQFGQRPLLLLSWHTLPVYSSSPSKLIILAFSSISDLVDRRALASSVKESISIFNESIFGKNHLGGVDLLMEPNAMLVLSGSFYRSLGA